MKRHDKHMIWAKDMGNRWAFWIPSSDTANIPADMKCHVVVPMRDYSLMRAAYNSLKANNFVPRRKSK